MKTLVAYASKYGTTEKCAKEVAEMVSGEYDLLDLKKSTEANLDKYEKVIVGGSINAGKIQKETTTFVNKYLTNLKTKKLGLFICQMEEDPEKAMLELTTNYPKELLDVAVTKEAFGGNLSFEKMNPVIRFMVKKIAKTDQNMSNLKPEKENNFINKKAPSR